MKKAKGKCYRRLLKREVNLHLARKPRVHVEGGFYHVMARGNNKQDIFLAPADYRYYLSLIEKYADRYGMEVHAYALMPNHVHLLLRVRTTPLSKFMQVVQQTYTQGFNRTYNQVGHLFQGRYAAKLIETDIYLLEVVRYIHLNPVEAGICQDPADYPWSSHRHYMTGKGHGKVTTDFVTSVLAAYGVPTIDNYQLLPDSVKSVAVRSLPASSAKDKDMQIKPILPPPLEKILTEVCSITGTDPAELQSLSRGHQVAQARRLFTYCACRIAHHKYAAVARFLGQSESTVSRNITYVSEKLREKDSKWKQLIDKLNFFRRRNG